MTITIAIVALGALVVLSTFAAMRGRQNADAVGMLSRETRKRDTASVSLEPAKELSGREVEKAVVAQREAASKEIVLLRRPSAPPAPYVQPDPETLGVTRRQFFNRSIVLMFGLGLSGFGVACIAFLWPQIGGGFGSAIKVGLVSDILAEIRNNNGFLYRADGRMWITEYPNGAVEKARAVYSGPELAGMQSGFTLGPRRRGCSAFPEVPASRMSGAQLRHIAMVRVPVPRLSVQPGGGETRWPSTAGHGPFRHVHRH